MPPRNDSTLTNLTMASSGSTAQRFPIPASLQDLEHAPYHLQPYPNDFDDVDEAARADSFERLLDSIEQGNFELQNGGVALFVEDDDGDDVWLQPSRLQALYTLVR